MAAVLLCLRAGAVRRADPASGEQAIRAHHEDHLDSADGAGPGPGGGAVLFCGAGGGPPGAAPAAERADGGDRGVPARGTAPAGGDARGRAGAGGADPLRLAARPLPRLRQHGREVSLQRRGIAGRHAGGFKAGQGLHLPGVFHHRRGHHVGPGAEDSGGQAEGGRGGARDVRRHLRHLPPALPLPGDAEKAGHPLQDVRPHPPDDLHPLQQPGPPENSGHRRQGSLHRRRG